MDYVVFLIIGAFVGSAIALYDYIIGDVMTHHWWNYLSNNTDKLWLSLFPLLAILLCASLVLVTKIKNRSLADEVVLSFHDIDHPHSIKHNLNLAFYKIIGSIITVGGGLALGIEGAAKWLGAVVAFIFSSFFKGKKDSTLLMSGGAAGIAAIFHAPFTGVIMGLESPYRENFDHDSLVYAMLASFSSHYTFIFWRGESATLFFPTISFPNYYFLAPIIIFSIVVGLTSHLFLLGSQKINLFLLRYTLLKKSFISGLILSFILFLSLYFFQLPWSLFSGKEIINELLTHKFSLSTILFFLVSRLLTTPFSSAGGGIGGWFMPTAVIGAFLGALFQYIAPYSNPYLYPVIGIFGMLASGFKGLLFTPVMALELTHDPKLSSIVMLTSTIAYLFSGELSNSPNQK